MKTYTTFSAVAITITSLTLAPPSAHADTITFAPSSLLTTSASNGTTSASNSTPPSIPLTAFPQSAVANDASASDLYTYSDSNFLTTFTHTRGGESGVNGGADAESFGQITFTPSTNLDYALSGNYNITDTNDTVSSAITIDVFLLDQTPTDVNLFRTSQSYDSSGNYDIATGAAGSLTGLLLANHTYEFQYQFQTTANDPEDQGASATGSISLQLTNPNAAVPLPNIFPLASSLLITFLALTRITTRPSPKA